MKNYNPKVISLMANCFVCGDVTTKKHKIDEFYLCNKCNKLNPVELYDSLTDRFVDDYNISDDELDEIFTEIINHWDGE